MVAGTSSHVRLLTTALNPIAPQSWSLLRRNAGNWDCHPLPSAQGNISYFSSSSSSSMSLARYLLGGEEGKGGRWGEGEEGKGGRGGEGEEGKGGREGRRGKGGERGGGERGEGGREEKEGEEGGGREEKEGALEKDKERDRERKYL